MALLDVQHIDTFYGPSQALFDVSLSVEESTVTGLLGRNGAGKSTTLKSVMGLVPPKRGSIAFRGQEVLGREPYQISRLGVGYVPEDRRIFPTLTVLENLETAKRPPRNGTRVVWDVDRVFQLFPSLKALANRRGSTLSGGEQQMLTIARTLMGNPDLLLLDEPSEGLAPLVVQTLKAQLQELKATGLTILLSEQNLKFAHGLVDRVYVIEKGQIQYEGTTQELEANEALRRQYLTV